MSVWGLKQNNIDKVLYRDVFKAEEKNSTHVDDQVEARSKERKQYISIHFNIIFTVVSSNFYLQAWNIKDVKPKVYKELKCLLFMYENVPKW